MTLPEKGFRRGEVESDAALKIAGASQVLALGLAEGAIALKDLA